MASVSPPLSSRGATDLCQFAFTVVFELSIQFLLITMLQPALVARSIYVCDFEDVWPFYKTVSALYVLSFSSAVFGRVALEQESIDMDPNSSCNFF